MAAVFSFPSSFLRFYDSLFCGLHWISCSQQLWQIHFNLLLGLSFNLISRVLISPIHLLAAIWFTMVTPFLAAKNPILMKFVIPWRIRDFIYVGIRPSRPPHASWVVNWLGKQAGGYTHIRYTPTCLLAVPWAVTNGSVSELLHIISHTETQRPLWVLSKSCDIVLSQLHGTWISLLNFFSPLRSHLLNVCYFHPSSHDHFNLFGGLRPKFYSWALSFLWFLLVRANCTCISCHVLKKRLKISTAEQGDIVFLSF